jgi:hypothetical protein
MTTILIILIVLYFIINVILTGIYIFSKMFDGLRLSILNSSLVLLFGTFIFLFGLISIIFSDDDLME